MKSLKDLLQQSKQKTYMLGQAFAEGTWVENTNGEVGKIHRRGVNYIIAVTSEGKMFRSWVKDIKEHCGCEEPKQTTAKDTIKSFINKNKRKKTNDD